MDDAAAPPAVPAVAPEPEWPEVAGVPGQLERGELAAAAPPPAAPELALPQLDFGPEPDFDFGPEPDFVDAWGPQSADEAVPPATAELLPADAGAPLVDPAQAAALLTGLNAPQAQAVTHAGSPLLIIAGAGSGKTRVLTHRVAHLIATGRARPSEILAITFTNKAAKEMRERVEALVGAAARHMWVFTFHAACVRILRREYQAAGLRSSFSIYDAQDAQRLMAQIVKAMGLDPKRFAPKAFSRRVSDLKNELVTPADFADQVSAANPFERHLAAAYAAYDAGLRQAHALDFDDIIMRTVELLTAHPQLAEKYRRRFRHVLVDEYQDTNHAQYVLVRTLVGEGPAGQASELTVVGDSDQSIYAFRGATIRNIEEFEKDYPAARTILLEQNYRSTQNILSAANRVISRNQGRRAKNLWTQAGAGDKIVLFAADSEYDEARFVVDEIDRLVGGAQARALDYGEVAVFYRTNAQSRALEDVLVRAGIPYRVVGGTRFYERREIKDAIAYLRVIANPDDSVNLRRILNVPKRGLGDKAEAALALHAERHGISFGGALAHAVGRAAVSAVGAAPVTAETITEPETGLVAAAASPVAAALPTPPPVEGLASRTRGQLREFDALLEELRAAAAAGVGPAELLDQALDRTGYLAELRASTDPQDQSRVDNLAELHAVAQEYQQRETAPTLADFLERIALVADSDQLPDAQTGRGEVTLMTVHTAKGLEFPIVFVTGLEDGTFPHARSLESDAELSEERRLAYVALTRARQRLYLTRAAVRNAFAGATALGASRFLDDIPADLLEVRRAATSVEQYRGRGDAGTRRRAAWDDDDFAPPIGTGRPRGAAPIGRLDLAAKQARSAPAASEVATDAEGQVLQAGDRVSHDTFGLGTVLGIEGVGRSAVAKIDFGAGSVKRILLRLKLVTKL
ncbi:UvrD-helicase domain-containing protein [Buchananella hordeovulneris]|uniref:UvrD-helicase domain-containing protein n=1 Tax=Buchananella hordeovulneris TaxID=52770 RepID=UPI0009FBE140|nr:UvrD-helicase domain-containing protein [Buchananella hordeovulneris]